MNATELNKLAEILFYSLLITPILSILIMFGGKKIFKKASKKETTIFYPIINLFTMLEVAEISIFWGILFFVPIVNIIVMILMFYKLGTVFGTGLFYKIGLIILPIVFYPLLANSNKQYKLADQEYFKLLDNIKNKSINLMTQADVDEINKQVDEDEKKEVVDSIFKSDAQVKGNAEPYRAIRIDVLGLNKLKNKENTKNKENKKQKNNDVEFLDL